MKNSLSVIVLSVLEIVIGVLLLVNPAGLTKWIVMAVGIILTVTGIISVIRYFTTPAPEAAVSRSLVSGLTAVIAGVWLIAKREWFIALFPLMTTIYGVFVLISGIAKVQWTADMLRLKVGRWWVMAISAAVTVICAVIILAHPFATTEVLWTFIGITMIVEAIIDIVAAIFKKSQESRQQ